ncbi:hypothetical protein SELMODRAFT_417817 [Selaginella moellendorffii]|uniref:VQ domain-containing protein n=1 Tax=Selaginella moellendorffii TaxID=88036 RepID=D8S3Q5_SELML|nr:hypothetical protein SELMODRAFT_417817 [Selaginella moellendorffii]
MGWETEYQENLAFKSQAGEALEMELQSPGSLVVSKLPSWSSSSGHLHDHKSSDDQSWDPVMTSLLKAGSNVASQSPTFDHASSSFLHTSATTGAFAPGFPKSSSDETAAEHRSGTGILVAGSSVLNAPSSAGATSTKVSKKRSRASRRPPTTVLEADSANFRSMVQHLTGIPAPPPMLASSFRPARFDYFGASPGLVRPQPTRSALSFGHHGGAPGGFSIDGGSASGGFLQTYQPPYSLRRLEEFRGFSYVSGRGGSSVPSSHGSFMDPASPGGIYSSMQATPGVINARPSHGTTQEGVYVPHSATNPTTTSSSSSALAMPSLWECEAREGDQSVNARIKREAGGRAEEATTRSSSGRPIASWCFADLPGWLAVFQDTTQVCKNFEALCLLLS